MNWKYHKPIFEYEEKFQDTGWPWAGHKHFAYDLVANTRPKKIVELGTHYGTSLWSFSQAVKDQEIDTEINAIDNWKGEVHAGFYGEEVYETVKFIKDKFYSRLNVNLIRKNFDEASDNFEDSSIDILHIDGLHTYEAVKHDFEKWFPKVKPTGIVLLHDTKVSIGDFGVYKIWDELRKKYPTIEFHHSFGLGVLFKGESDIKKNIMDRQEELQRQYYYIHEKIKNKKINSADKILKNCHLKIEHMENSKFWKLRNRYIKIKKILKLK